MKGLARGEVLELRPVRLAEWSEPDPDPGKEPGAEPETGETGERQRVVIERPLPPVRGLRSLVQRVSALTGVRRVRLDARGSFVWRRIDGERTVADLARDLAAEFGAEVEPADERVALLLRSLDRERFVELRGPAGEPVKLGRS
jgi:hypothetical protein